MVIAHDGADARRGPLSRGMRGHGKTLPASLRVTLYVHWRLPARATRRIEPLPSACSAIRRPRSIPTSPNEGSSSSAKRKRFGLPALAFDPAADILFDHGPAVPGHANRLTFESFDTLQRPSTRSAAASSSRRPSAMRPPGLRMTRRKIGRIRSTPRLPHGQGTRPIDRRHEAGQRAD